MSIILRFPPINPFRFAESNLTIPDKWGYPAFGRALQIDSIKPCQVKEQYYQKVGLSDPVCIQCHRGRTGDNSNINNPSELRIFEVGTNAQLKVLGIAASNILPGVTDSVTGEQLYTEQFLFTPESLPELNGKKYIYFELWHYYHTVGFSNDTIYRSNPIMLSACHKGTSLVEYNQSVNGHDILFENLFPRFAYRVESKGMTYEPGGDYTVFEDQDRSTVTLDAEAFNVFKWDIGGDTGLPEYMVDIVNRSLQCCKDGYFRVDGREYVWKDGKLDSTGGEGKHMQWRTVMLRQKDEEDGYTFTARKVKLFTATAYPFAIGGCIVSDHFTSISVLTGGHGAKVFDDEGGMTAWIGQFNTNIAAAGYAGIILKEGDDLFILNAEGERFFNAIPVFVFPDMMQITALVNTPVSVDFQYKMVYPDTLIHFHVVCYGGISGTEEIQGNSFGNNTCTVTKRFTTNGTKTVRIFHRNEEIRFESVVPSLSTLVDFTTFTGKVSSRLEFLKLTGHDFNALSSFNLNVLAPARDTLAALILDNCGIKAFTADWASDLNAGTYKPYNFLTFTEIKGNPLTSTAVDNFLNEYYNFVKLNFGFGFYTIDISGNTPAAPPTIASSAARAGFAALSWYILTN